MVIHGQDAGRMAVRCTEWPIWRAVGWVEWAVGPIKRCIRGILQFYTSIPPDSRVRVRLVPAWPASRPAVYSVSCRNSTTACRNSSGFSLITQCPALMSTNRNLGKNLPMVGSISSAT